VPADAMSEEQTFRSEVNGSGPYESLLVPIVPKVPTVPNVLNGLNSLNIFNVVFTNSRLAPRSRARRFTCGIRVQFSRVGISCCARRWLIFATLAESSAENLSATGSLMLFNAGQPQILQIDEALCGR
jgi:hypothetical protein